MSITVRPASTEDFPAFAGFAIPEDYSITKPIGYVAERGDSIIAIGLVTWDIFGRAWGWLNLHEPLPAVTLHRRALAMLVILREVGEPEIHAFCGGVIPGAEMWLRRLGFAKDDVLTAALDRDGNPKNLTVWSCSL